MEQLRDTALRIANHGHSLIHDGMPDRYFPVCR